MSPASPSHVWESSAKCSLASGDGAVCASCMHVSAFRRHSLGLPDMAPDLHIFQAGDLKLSVTGWPVTPTGDQLNLQGKVSGRLSPFIQTRKSSTPEFDNPDGSRKPSNSLQTPAPRSLHRDFFRDAARLAPRKWNLGRVSALPANLTAQPAYPEVRSSRVFLERISANCV